jgi:hypothetical protein
MKAMSDGYKEDCTMIPDIHLKQRDKGTPAEVAPTRP